MVQKNKYLPQLNIIRGLASLFVCYFHIVCGNPSYISSTNFFEIIASYGYLGLNMFFVLSGFVICWSLPETYTLNDAFIFLKKRLVRIEPPYLFSILLVIIILFGSSYIRKVDYTLDWIGLLSHLAYINNFTGSSYINIVYWTLGIEFQFYLLICLFYGFLVKNKFSICLGLLIFNCLILINTPQMSLINSYTALFSLGIVTNLFLKEKLLLFEYIFFI